MTPETASLLEKADELLTEADVTFGVALYRAAGRAAYLAGCSAARALLSEKTGRSPKTHSGLQAQFALLVRDDPRFDQQHRAFLGRTYNLKAIADYESGPGAQVTDAQAAEAIAGARQFVATIKAILSP